MDVYKHGAEIIKQSEVLVITAGAGIGVDSGLPDFRGERGFWKAYPMYEKLGLNFYDCANPVHFKKDPAFGWGFYGHRLELYRKTQPHKGFNILLKWIEDLSLDFFVVTSKVDGQFQKAGFPDEKVYEIHGSIHYLQCLTPCCGDIWENKEKIEIDYNTMRAKNIPRCIHCGTIARPNILMFGDFSWISSRSDAQSDRFNIFLEKNRGKKMTVLEIGAGTAVPSIRYLGERLASGSGVNLIRINPREYQVPSGHLSIPDTGLKALEKIDSLLR